MVGNVTESLPANPYGLYLRAQDSNAQYLYERNALYVTDVVSLLDSTSFSSRVLSDFVTSALSISDSLSSLGASCMSS
jgi:hypothetical protein